MLYERLTIPVFITIKSQHQIVSGTSVYELDFIPDIHGLEYSLLVFLLVYFVYA